MRAALAATTALPAPGKLRQVVDRAHTRILGQRHEPLEDSRRGERIRARPMPLLDVIPEVVRQAVETERLEARDQPPRQADGANPWSVQSQSTGPLQLPG